MDLTVLIPPEEGAWPVAAFRAELRLGTGFADEASQDAELRAFLMAAAAAIEGQTSKVLLSRRLRLRVYKWRRPDAQPLPVAPVLQVLAIRLLDRNGEEILVDPSSWRLRADRHRPQIVGTGVILPQIPAGGAAEIDFEAGFGTAWADSPPELRQAVFLLAAELYHARTGTRGDWPQAVRALIAPWEPVRLTAGGHRG